MFVLQETPAGFALFKVDDKKVKAAEKEVRYYIKIERIERN